MKVFDYEHLEVGEDLGTRSIAITDELIDDYRAAVGATHEWYSQSSPFGRRIAPPTIFDNECLRMLDARYARFGSIHARQAWSFLKPVPVGSTVQVNVRIVDKFVKRDKGWFVMELTATDQDGDTVCRGRHTSVVSLVRKVTAHGA
ncbi:MAG TPA: MaoC family dehydratase [Candidatus Methylomirabilis sp.]|nr:MaoC family dehydratase [Candidatus Methylomirabilis sp.]